MWDMVRVWGMCIVVYEDVGHDVCMYHGNNMCWTWIMIMVVIVGFVM